MKDISPNPDRGAIRPDEKGLAAQRRHEPDGEPPQSIEIYWQDLTPAKQSEILRIFGENGNWDVFPLVTLDAPENEVPYGQEQIQPSGMETSGM